MTKKPSSLYELIQEESWLEAFCTYKQQRAILHWVKEHTDQKPLKIEIEEGEGSQNFITLHFKGGKITF